MFTGFALPHSTARSVQSWRTCPPTGHISGQAGRDGSDGNARLAAAARRVSRVQDRADLDVGRALAVVISVVISGAVTVALGAARVVATGSVVSLIVCHALHPPATGTQHPAHKYSLCGSTQAQSLRCPQLAHLARLSPVAIPFSPARLAATARTVMYGSQPQPAACLPSRTARISEWVLLLPSEYPAL